MYAIFLRSQREPIIVDDVVGIKLKDLWMSNKLPKRIDVGEWVGESDQIKAIKSNAKTDDDDFFTTMHDTQSEKTKAYFQQVDREYESYRNEKLKLPPAERAKNLSIAKMVWQAHTHQKSIPDEIADEVIKRQEQFFIDNPKYAHANPICYRDLMEKHGDAYTDPFSISLMRIVERACLSDKIEARKVTVKI